MTDLISEILATLRHNKLRTALTGFAVSWGIFLLIVLLSVSRGLVNGMEYMFDKRDSQVMTLFGGWAHKPYKGLKDDREIALVEGDMPVVETRHSAWVSDVAVQIEGSSVNISTSKDYINQGYIGAYPSGLRSDGGTLTSGRFINDADLREARKVMVIHDDNVPILFGQTDPVGQRVVLNDLSFTVVGTYSHEWNRRCFIPYTTARNLAGGSDTLGRMVVKVRNLDTPEAASEAEQQLRATMGRRHSFDPTDESAIWVHNRLRDHMTTSSAMGYMQMAVWVIGILTMLSGIVGVSNIMFVSVRERTHEIGVRRAIGARPLSILRQIILESVAITTLFGYVGIVFGVAVAQIIGMATAGGEHQILRDPTVDLSIALQVTAVLILAGAFAGLFPALKSLKIKPVEALRDE